MELIYELYAAWVIFDLMGVMNGANNNHATMKKARKALRKDFLIRAYKDRTERAKEPMRACMALRMLFI